MAWTPASRRDGWQGTCVQISITPCSGLLQGRRLPSTHRCNIPVHNSQLVPKMIDFASLRLLAPHAVGGRVGSVGRCWLCPAVDKIDPSSGDDDKHLHRPVVCVLSPAFRVKTLLHERRGMPLRNCRFLRQRTSGHRDSALSSGQSQGDQLHNYCLSKRTLLHERSRSPIL